MVSVSIKSQNSPVDSLLIERAIKALLTHHDESATKSSLLGDDVPLQVEFTLARIPENHSPRPIRVQIPHPLHKVLNDGESDQGVDEVEACLFVKDESKEWVQSVIEKFPQELGCIKKVLTLTSLRKKYTQYKDRRELLKSYHIFLADDRILPMLGKAIGKNFFQEKKQPVPIKLTRKESLPHAVKKCLRSTFMYISAGTCISVKAGNSAMPVEQLVANAMAITSNAVDQIPRKWNNICAINIKTSQSIALPVYNKSRDELKEIEKMANVGAVGDKKRSREEELSSETHDTKKKQKKELAAKSPLVKALKKKKAKGESERSAASETRNEEKPVGKKKKGDVSEEKDVLNATPQKASTFIASKKFKGSKKGYVFRMGNEGLGYYKDKVPVPDKAALQALSRMSKSVGKSKGGRRRSKGRR